MFFRPIKPLPVCQVCNLKSLENIPVAKLGGTVFRNDLMYCRDCWCKKHNGPKPVNNKSCFICYPKKKR